MASSGGTEFFRICSAQDCSHACETPDPHSSSNRARYFCTGVRWTTFTSSGARCCKLRGTATTRMALSSSRLSLTKFRETTARSSPQSKCQASKPHKGKRWKERGRVAASGRGREGGSEKETEHKTKPGRSESEREREKEEEARRKANLFIH